MIPDVLVLSRAMHRSVCRSGRLALLIVGSSIGRVDWKTRFPRLAPTLREFNITSLSGAWGQFIVFWFPLFFLGPTPLFFIVQSGLGCTFMVHPDWCTPSRGGAPFCQRGVWWRIWLRLVSHLERLWFDSPLPTSLSFF